MSEPDVVAELDAAFAELPATSRYNDDYAVVLPASLVQRARDEIVALRADRDERAAAMVQEIVTKRLLSAARAEALEEAAQLCFRANPQSNPNAMGHAIRARKDKRDG